MIGRIVSASLHRFMVEALDQGSAPALGALVAVAEAEPPIYGVVCSIVTEGIDPSRPVAPHGAPDEDLQTVLSRNPHLPVLLRMTFEAVVVGYEREGTICQYLPDAPPRLISRVRLCDQAEQEHFAQRLDFLIALLDCGQFADDVVAAFLRRTAAAAPDGRRFLVEAGRALVPLLVDQPERLTALLRRIRPQESMAS